MPGRVKTSGAPTAPHPPAIDRVKHDYLPLPPTAIDPNRLNRTTQTTHTDTPLNGTTTDTHHPPTGERSMAAKDKQKEGLEKVTDYVEDRQLDADRMAKV